MSPILGPLLDEHALECQLPKFFVAPFVAGPFSGFSFDIFDIIIPRYSVWATGPEFRAREGWRPATNPIQRRKESNPRFLCMDITPQ
jgi:hypothetical protein